ncbi:hypothetical protein PUNSTDRAFT_136711 [Punctularia strigosozonata HHB-11173 SS5]|uniref:uncharacterized protein n=1 Tax=Punctularia strigosozonata (strain HHB-11173) TaxID=741275 RepID=UPI00044184A1|nr:uncharacterized protein PUNSTDRAFT_136711 [Punctularia strigosozonata HHB-11173 SS5]EIN06892.1 hypothetical protein PUNSTDRAFT_136711 [Punctularia strigosozonata HHB-11173 SS5]
MQTRGRSLSLTLALLALVPATLAQTACPAGSYNTETGEDPCTACPAGQYQDQTGQTACINAQAGYFVADTGATAQTICPAGSYSATEGSTECTTCPAGSSCPTEGETAPVSCQPGQFQDQTGATTCNDCAAGSFSDVSGATACCTCCSGFYQDQTGQTSCTICPAEGTFVQGYSDPGATNVEQCTAQSGAVATCDQDTSTGTCPTTTADPATPTGGTRKRAPLRPRSGSCARGQSSCPVYKNGAVSGYECVNTSMNLEQCGGCVTSGGGLDGARSLDGGRDCSAISQVDEVSCFRGGCHIKSCRAGYEVSEGGERCQASKRTTRRRSQGRKSKKTL